MDFAAIPVLKKHVEFLIDRYNHFVETGSKPDGLDELFSTEWTRMAISTVVEKGVGHLSQVRTLECYMKGCMVPTPITESRPVDSATGMGTRSPTTSF